MIYTTLMHVYAGTVLGYFNNLEILTSLMTVQLEPIHVEECMIENIKYLHLPKNIYTYT
jgi:hypothetical protein